MARERYFPEGIEPSAITDPGNAGSINSESPGYVNIVSAGAETRTLAIPQFLGQVISLNLQTDGGDVTLTVTNGWNQIGNTAVVFNDAGDSATFIGVQVGSALEWRVVHLDGAIAKEEISDPGDGVAIPVTASGYVNLVSAGAETRTVAVPTFEGQLLQLNFKTDGGNCVVTTATGANQTGNNTLTFADAGDHILLQGAILGANLVWRIVANDGVGLSTV